MEFIHIQGESVRRETFISRPQILAKLHRVGERYLQSVYANKDVTTDMDGVLIHDDNAVAAALITAGSRAVACFDSYARKNIEAVSDGHTSYCWYAPTVFVGMLLKGLSPEINRAIGRHMRLVPDVEYSLDLQRFLGYNITAVTAGHQEAAEEVSRRVGITTTIGTQLGITDGVYDGTVQRFIGGKHKLAVVRDVLSANGVYHGTHVGDSWSDLETLAAISHSIAFNPGCEPALRGARISVVGHSHLALIPLLDPEGVCDGELQSTVLPQQLIVMENPAPSLDLTDMLRPIREIKKNVIEEYVTDRHGSFKHIENLIRVDLARQNIRTTSAQSEFLAAHEFDAHAKAAYSNLPPLLSHV